MRVDGHQVYGDVESNEIKRVENEGQLIKSLTIFKVINDSKRKVLTQLKRKILGHCGGINEVYTLTVGRTVSGAQLHHIMGDYKQLKVDVALKYGILNVKDDSIVLQLNQIVEAIHCHRDKLAFFLTQVKFDQEQQAFYSGIEIYPQNSKDQLDTTVIRNDIATKAFKRLLQHNKTTKVLLGKRYLPQESASDAKAMKDVANEKDKLPKGNLVPLDKSKGFETLQMLEAALGVQQKTSAESINKVAVQINRTNEAFFLNSAVLAESRPGTQVNFYASKSSIAPSDADNRNKTKSELQSKRGRPGLKSDSSPDNEFFKIQEEYLNNLDESYSTLQSLKKAKKFQVLRAISMIQKFWRFRNVQRKRIAVHMIESYYKQYRARDPSKNDLKLRKIRHNVLKRKLALWLQRTAVKRRISKLTFHVETLQHFKQDTNLALVIVVQSLARRWLARRHLVNKKAIEKLRRNINTKRQLFRKLQLVLKPKSQKQTLQLQLLTQLEISEQSCNDFIRDGIINFEQGWAFYEARLKKYLLNYQNFKDWAPQQTKYGEKFWLNIKTMEETVESPGEKYFETNRKQLRKKAEAKFRTETLDRLEALREKKSNSLKLQVTGLDSDVKQMGILGIKRILNYNL